MSELRHLRALQAFNEAVRNSSLSGAAESLGVTHGAVSRQVKQLEQYLGVKLFHRHPGGVEPTKAGETLHAVTHQAFTLLKSGIENVKRDPRQQSITISMSTSLAIKWLLPRLPEFRVQNPRVSVFFDTNDEIIDFNDPEITAALRYGSPEWHGLYHEKLTDEDLIIAAAPSLVADKNLPLPPRSIASLPLLHDMFDPAWNRWAEGVGLNEELDDSLGVQFSNMALLIAAAINGQGVIMARRLLIEDDLAAGRLVRLDDTSTHVERALYFVCRDGDQDRYPIRVFKTWVTSALNHDARK